MKLSYNNNNNSKIKVKKKKKKLNTQDIISSRENIIKIQGIMHVIMMNIMMYLDNSNRCFIVLVAVIYTCIHTYTNTRNV